MAIMPVARNGIEELASLFRNNKELTKIIHYCIVQGKLCYIELGVGQYVTFRLKSMEGHQASVTIRYMGVIAWVMDMEVAPQIDSIAHLQPLLTQVIISAINNRSSVLQMPIINVPEAYNFRTVMKSYGAVKRNGMLRLILNRTEHWPVSILLAGRLAADRMVGELKDDGEAGHRCSVMGYIRSGGTYWLLWHEEPCGDFALILENHRQKRIYVSIQWPLPDHLHIEWGIEHLFPVEVFSDLVGRLLLHAFQLRVRTVNVYFEVGAPCENLRVALEGYGFREKQHTRGMFQEFNW